MLVEAQAAQDAIAALQVSLAVMMKLTCPVTLLHVHIGPMLAVWRVILMFRYSPETNRRRLDVVEGVDVAIRVEPRPFEDSDTASRLTEASLVYRQPDLIARMGIPSAPAELSHWLWARILHPASISTAGTLRPGERACGSPFYPYDYHRHVALREAAMAWGRTATCNGEEQLAAGELWSRCWKSGPGGVRLFMLCSHPGGIITFRTCVGRFLTERVCADGGSNLLVIHQQWTQRLVKPTFYPAALQGVRRQLATTEDSTAFARVSSTVTCRPSGCGCSSYAFYRRCAVTT